MPGIGRSQGRTVPATKPTGFPKPLRSAPLSLVPPEVDGSASFVQAAASWDAVAAETGTSSATFTQAAASWAATANESLAAASSWTQPASAWSASAAETTAASSSSSGGGAAWRRRNQRYIRSTPDSAPVNEDDAVVLLL